MENAPICRSGPARVAAGLAILAIGALSGCESSTPEPASGAAAKVADLPSPGGSLPDVTVTLGANSHSNAEASGRAWYVTAVKDPTRGNYTAALERRSLNPLWFDNTPSDSEQRAAIVVVLRNGRPTDLMLSVDHGKFVCRSQESDSSCALRVSVDGKLLRPVWFAVPRHWPPSHLHLVAGGDAARLLASISKAKQLRVQPTFEEEGSPEIEFALTGLNRAIGRVVKRSTTMTPKLASAGPAG